MRIDRTRVASLWLALVLVLATGSAPFAQTGAASITGLVTDQSGAAAPGVTVSAVNQATNVVYTGISNSAGNYTITACPNQFRGNVFEFYRNSDLDANTWENNRSGAPRQKRKQHIYGATLGGPLVKEKLFFFADYQGSRQDAPGSGTASVAPEAWRRGDLSSVSVAM